MNDTKLIGAMIQRMPNCWQVLGWYNHDVANRFVVAEFFDNILFDSQVAARELADKINQEPRP